MNGFRFGRKKALAPQSEWKLPDPPGPILCAHCEEPIRIADEDNFSVSEYRARLFIATREVHRRCLVDYARKVQ